MKIATPEEGLYTLSAHEEDARVCADINEEACRRVPGNFFRIIVALEPTSAASKPPRITTWRLIASLAQPGLVARQRGKPGHPQNGSPLRRLCRCTIWLLHAGQSRGAAAWGGCGTGAMRS